MNIFLKSEKGVSFVLRPATRADIPELIATERVAEGVRTYSPMLETYEWEEALDAGPVFLLKEGETTLGNFSFEKEDQDRIHLTGIILYPAFRGKGIARAVLTHCIEEYPHRSCYLETHPENPAKTLYESLGFVVTDRKENCYGDGEPRLVLTRIGTK